MKQLSLLGSALPIALLALSACAEPIEERPEAEETMMPVEPDGGIGDGAEPLPDLSEATIPEAFHGRWGINPGDCTDKNGDAKGSIQISENQLRFYESRATLGEVSESETGTIRAKYDFVGEGQEWSRDIKLAISEDGTQLTRTEYGEDAMAEPLTYTKCQA